MALENTGAKIAADYDAVTSQIAALRDELAKLAQHVSSVSTQRGQAVARDVTDGVNEAMNYVTRKGHAADVRFEGAVSANPYIALGLAAGMGVLLGALTRR